MAFSSTLGTSNTQRGQQRVYFVLLSLEWQGPHHVGHSDVMVSNPYKLAYALLFPEQEEGCCSTAWPVMPRAQYYQSKDLTAVR